LLSLCGCSTLAVVDAPFFRDWRRGTPRERSAILEQCVANDFRDIVGKRKDAVIKFLGQPDAGGRFTPDSPKKPYEHLTYACGSFSDNPGSAEYDPQVHQALDVVLDDEGIATAIRVRLTNFPPFFAQPAQPTNQEKQTEPSVVKTPEIIRLLEEESITFIGTTHSQSIHIQLKDGSRYKGSYLQNEAGKYSTDPHLSDILNLVIHIKKQRPPDDVKGWQILCE